MLLYIDHVRLTTLYCLASFSIIISEAKLFDTSWVHLQKAGAVDTGCLHALLEDDTISDTTFSMRDERKFLVDFYLALNGRYWKNNSHWRDPVKHHCDWYGIECYPNNTYVKSIALIGNNLRGTIPNLWRFRNLQGICLAENKRASALFRDIVSRNMTRLRRLCISFCDIHGTIPWETIVTLENLEKIQICCMVGKCLNGGLPRDIGMLYKLQVLSVGENSVKEGPLPPSIANLTRMWFLDLEYMHLTSGSLHYFDNMTNVLSLHLTNCRLRSRIPPDFGRNHPLLTDALLCGNRIEGDLTGTALIGLDNLQIFSLCRNNLKGMLPREMGILPNLKVLDLSQNDFNGLEAGTKFNTSLEILYMNDNLNMNTDIKDFVGALQTSKESLRILVASRCGLTGELGNSLDLLTLLTYVDLSGNNLLGIFTITSNMLYLFHLNLAANNFCGSLDTVRFFMPLKALTYFNITSNPLLRIPLKTYLKPNYEYEFISSKHGFICPAIKITSTHGIADIDASSYNYSLCFCKQGYYGHKSRCFPCMAGGVCGDRPTGDNGSEIQMKIKSGYWPYRNSAGDVERLVKCPHGSLMQDQSCSPSGTCECVVDTASQRARTVCNSSCICAHGTTDRFCSRCIKGFYKRRDNCVACPEFRQNFPLVVTICFVACLISTTLPLVFLRSHKRLVLFFMFILVIVLTVLHFSDVIPGWFFILMTAVWVVGLYTEATGIQSFICIAVFYFQSLDAMLSEADIWPRAIILLKYKITNIFNLELAQLICSFSSTTEPDVILLIVLCLPLAGIILIWLVYVLSRIRCRPDFINAAKCKQLTIQILLFVYFPVTAKSLAALSPCNSTVNISYLSDAPWLDCDGGTSERLTTIGYVSLACFVIGVPLFVFIPPLWKRLDGEGNPTTEEAAIYLRPLYEEFKPPQRKWFPIFFLSRRLLLAVLLSLVPATTSYQITGITILLIGFMILILLKKPYQEYSENFAFENMADVIISTVLLISFVGLAFIRESSSNDYPLLWFILSLNFVIVFFCVLGIFGLFVANISGKQEADDIQYEQLPN